jgi:hypothetical protein
MDEISMKQLIKKLDRILSGIMDGLAQRPGGRHLWLIEDYCENTCQEWRWFTKDEQELDRRKNLLLQTLGEGLPRRTDLARNGREPPPAALPGWEGSKVREDGRRESPLLASVHVLSPSLRSGTNLLAFLLIESGCCQWPLSDRIAAEDFFLKHAHLIEESCDRICKEWRGFTKDEQQLDRRKNWLLQSIGQRLLQYADPNALKAPVVLKTPDAGNIALLPRLFPQSRFLFIIRDGRDAVASAATAFPLAGYEYWMNRWAQGTRSLLEFMQRSEENSQSASWKLIRYEELIKEQSSVVQEIFDFLGSRSKFTWRDLQSLPVYGSSYLCRENGKFKWEIKSKPENFDPFGRWTLWGEDVKQKFKKIAGAELIKLGYVEDDRW